MSLYNKTYSHYNLWAFIIHVLIGHDEHHYYQLTTFASIKYMTGKTKRSEPQTGKKKYIK
jgi:hypothetical protein